MDDDKTIDTATHKLTIAGEEYEFGQPDPELLERMVLVNHMNAGGGLVLEAVTLWLSSGATPTVWQAIMKRFVHGGVTAQDLMDAMHELAKKIAEDAASDAA